MPLCYTLSRASRTFLLAASLALAAFSPVGPLAAQEGPGTWERVPGIFITGARHDDVSFVDAQTGWVTNSWGEVYATTNGGASWTRTYSTQAALGRRLYFRSTVFVDATHGWVGTFSDSTQVLWETTDGGRTFANVSGRISGPMPQGLCGMWAVDAQTVYGVGMFYDYPRLIKTTDGGATWTSHDLSHLVDALVDVRFFDADHGIAVGRVYEGEGTGTLSHAAVIQTDDGGATWALRHVSSGDDEWAWKVAFPTRDVGYVAVQNFEEAEAKVLKTTNGGATWTELALPPGTFFSGIAFLNADVGWVGGTFGDGTASLAVTTDGGATWATPAQPHDPSVINRIRFFTFGGETVGYAGGGAVYRYRPTTSAAEGPVEALGTQLGAPIPNPFVDRTFIPYSTERAGRVRLEVFDLVGRRVAVLVDEEQAAGPHLAPWDGTDGTGRPVPVGTYLYRLTAGGVTVTNEAIRMR